MMATVRTIWSERRLRLDNAMPDIHDGMVADFQEQVMRDRLER